MPSVIAKRCPQNHPCPCVSVCPVDAISQINLGAPSINQNKCIRCGLCVDLCPQGAIVERLRGASARA
jgi:Fe-S-cluster-containing hydrogenase component 2